MHIAARRATPAAAVLLALSLAPAACSTNPATGRTQFNALTREQEIAIGQEATPQLIQEFGGEIPSPRLQAYVDEVGRRIANYTEADNPSLPWEFTALNGPEVNAFALPGGKVFISRGMLDHAAALGRSTGIPVPLVQAGAEHLPFADDVFDLACSAFGGVPFVAEPDRVMREVARVLRPGGRWVFAVNHPMRWMFSDDPGEEGLIVRQSYFDRTPYVEVDANGAATYVEHHRTMGDRIRDIVAAGLVVEDVVEPEWPEGLDRVWGQWSPLRGALFPGTAIFVSRKPARA